MTWNRSVLLSGATALVAIATALLMACVLGPDLDFRGLSP